MDEVWKTHCQKKKKKGILIAAIYILIAKSGKFGQIQKKWLFGIWIKIISKFIQQTYMGLFPTEISFRFIYTFHFTNGKQ
jgi:hypothetical protein